MSDAILDELGVPEPNFHLRVGSGTHAERTGDVILAIEGETMATYGAIAEIINESIDIPLELTWIRDGRTMKATVTPEAAEGAVSFSEVQTVGRIYYEPYMETQSVSFAQAATMGSRATWRFVTQTDGFLKATVTGKASKDAVSGPLRIAKFVVGQR